MRPLFSRFSLATATPAVPGWGWRLHNNLRWRLAVRWRWAIEKAAGCARNSNYRRAP